MVLCSETERLTEYVQNVTAGYVAIVALNTEPKTKLDNAEPNVPDMSTADIASPLRYN